MGRVGVRDRSSGARSSRSGAVNGLCRVLTLRGVDLPSRLQVTVP